MKDSNLKIEKFNSTDSDALLPLIHQFVQSHPSLPFRENYESVFQKWLTDGLNDANSLCLMAKLEGKIVGFISGVIRDNSPLLSPEQIGHVSVIVVDAESRLKGVGESLWEEMRRWFLSRNIDHFELYTEYGNENAGPFWSKKGFDIFLEKRRLY